MTLNSARFLAQVGGIYTLAQGEGVATFQIDADARAKYDHALADGTAVGQANRVYITPAAGLTLAPSASVNIDLSGIVADALSQPLVLVRVKGFFLYARSGNTNSVVVGGGTNPWLGWTTNGVFGSVAPDGLMFMVNPGIGSNNGWPVTAGTGDILKLLNGGAGTDVTLDLCIVGADA